MNGMMQQIAALDPTGNLLLGLLAVTFAVLIGYLVIRLATGHLQDDFMTPKEAARAYFGPNDNDQVPERPNKRAWIILFASFGILTIMLAIVQNFR